MSLRQSRASTRRVCRRNEPDVFDFFGCRSIAAGAASGVLPERGGDAELAQPDLDLDGRQDVLVESGHAGAAAGAARPAAAADARRGRHLHGLPAAAVGHQQLCRRQRGGRRLLGCASLASLWSADGVADWLVSFFWQPVATGRGPASSRRTKATRVRSAASTATIRTDPSTFRTCSSPRPSTGPSNCGVSRCPSRNRALCLCVWNEIGPGTSS